METKNGKLYVGGVSCETLVKKYGSPLYVYDEEMIRRKVQSLLKAVAYPKFSIHYACKANSNLDILRIILQEGCRIDAVSPGEVFSALHVGFKPDDILFTGNNVTDDEMKYVIDKGIMVNIDSLSQLRRYGNMNPGGRISVRINPDVGAGHHDHCITGGPDSKFGIYFDKVDSIKKIAANHDLTIVGVHQHIGSGILDPDQYILAMDVLLKAAPEFANLEFVDFGGGIGVPYAPEDRAIDINRFGKKITDRFDKFCDDYGKKIELKIEPGRYPVCEAGLLLTTANTLKSTPKHHFVGTDSGFNHLIRHPLYLAYHEIVNASNMDGAEKRKYAVCGNICESGDLFTHGRLISEVKEGDVVAVLNAGAYGFSMSSNYNSRPRPAEVLVNGDKVTVVRKRQTYDDLLEGQNV